MTPARRLVGCLVVLALAAGLPAVRAADNAVTVSRAAVRSVDDVYLLDASAELRLTPPVRSALESGVALSFLWEAEIQRARGWWLDASVAEVVQRYRLEYHELSLHYLVTNANTGERRSFARLAPALAEIGGLSGFPLVDRVLIDAPARHYGYVRLRLEHDELPLPLRLRALFDDAWDLETQWHRWSFE